MSYGYNEMRVDAINDILFDIENLKCFQEYEGKNKYKVDYVNMVSTIKLLDKRIKHQIKEYEKEYNVKIPIYILKRYIYA